MIKFGSRTDLLIPIEEGLVFEPAIKVGSKVSGGSSILGTLRRAEGAA
jgi:hypothetical protein